MIYNYLNDKLVYKYMNVIHSEDYILVREMEMKWNEEI